MQEEYTGRLLEDGHLYIPKKIIDKLKVTTQVHGSGLESDED